MATPRTPEQIAAAERELRDYLRVTSPMFLATEPYPGYPHLRMAPAEATFTFANAEPEPKPVEARFTLRDLVSWQWWRGR